MEGTVSVLVGTRVAPEVRDALAELARRRSGTIAGELRTALAAHLRAAAKEEPARG